MSQNVDFRLCTRSRLAPHKTTLCPMSTATAPAAVGIGPTTYRLQGAHSALTMATTSDLKVHSDRSCGHIGSGGRQFASHVVSTPLSQQARVATVI
jgi:hypothetical protein